MFVSLLKRCIMNIKDAMNIIDIFKFRYRHYIKRTDNVYNDICDLEAIFKTTALRSGTDFNKAETLDISKSKFESLNAAYKCCFIQNKDNRSKLVCYNFMMDIHNSKFDVTLDICLN